MLHIPYAMIDTPLNFYRSACKACFVIVLFFGITCFPSEIKAQTSTEFWFAPPELTQGHAGTGNIYVRLAAGDAGATVNIDMPANPGALNGGSPITVVLAANQSQTVDLTAFINILETRPQATVLSTGLHITSTEEITAIYEAGPNNNVDIWALKGANGLGTEFYVPMQNLWPQGNYSPTPYTSFDIVATEDNTTILIYPTSDLDLPNGANGAAGGQPAFQSFTVTLDAGETYSAAVTDRNNPENNPSGSIILSNKPIAVSIKDDSISPPSQGCREAVGDQIVPVDIVGNEYIVNKGGLNAGSGEYAYVIATANNTEISVDGVFEATLFNAETYPIPITNDLTYISGSKDFYLIHVSGFGCESGMAQLPPLNCAGSEQVSFVRSTTESFFINLLVPAGAEDAFELNGGALTIDPADFDPVPGTGGAWVGAQIQFNTTDIPVGAANLITNSEEVFSLGLINGGASSGCRFGYFSEFSAEIIVDAGPDQTVCANRETELNGSVSGGATQGVWSTNGTGAFLPDANALDAVYEPSLADLSAGTVTLTLTSVSNCFPVEDDVVITYTPAPVVVAGDDISACENNTTVTLDGFVDIATGGVWSGGSGTFSPTSGTLDAEYTPSPAEVTAGSVVLTLTSTGNGTCFAEEDSLEITFGPAPTADAGPDQILCGNNAEAQLIGSVTIAGGGQWTGGTGTFSPSNQSLTPVYTPSPTEILNGSVTLTLNTTNNGGCSPVSDDIVLTFTPSPTVDAGSDQSYCRNNSDISLNGSVTVATGGTWSGGTGTYSPDANTLNAVYTPSLPELLAGSVTLTLTSSGNGDCNPVSDDVTFTFTDAPVVNAGADQDVCSNNPDISLNGSLIGANFGIWSGGAGSFSPSTTTLNATYTPTPAEIASGSITLTLTSLDNGTCNPESDDVTFTFTPSPTADAGVDISVCENNADVALSGAVTVATGGQWSGGGGTFTPGPTALNATYTPTAAEIASGSVTLTLTTTGNGNCVAVSDDVVVSFTDAPTANAGTNEILCANNAEISLSGSVTLATGGSWSGGLGIYTPDANTLNATYQPTAAEIASGSLTLTLTTTGNGGCNPVTDNVNFTFTPAPVVDAGTPISVCSNNAQLTLAGTVSGAGGGTWSGGAGTFIPNANDLNALYNPTAAEIASGSLILTLTSTGNGNCNPEQDVVLVNFTPSPTANAGSDVSVCANDPSVNLSGSVNLASGGVWSGGGGTFNPNNTSLGATYTPSPAEIAAGSVTLTLTTTGNGNCLAESDQMEIAITPAPTVEAGSGFEVCANNPDISLNGSVTVAGGASWSGGSGTFTPDANTLNAVYTPSQSEINNGSVTLTLTSTGNGNCVAVSDDVTYTFGPAPTADAGVDQVLCANNSDVALNGAVTLAGGGQWTGGAGIFTPNANTLNAVYTPTAAEISAGSLTLTLTTIGNGDCSPVSDDMVITFTPSPTANAGADQTVCANDPVLNLNGQVTVATGGIWTGGNGIFNPNNTTLGAVYTPSPAEIAAGSVTLTLITTSNGSCNPVSDQMTITISPAPVVEAGVGEELCSNNAAINLNGSVTGAAGGTWSGGSGTFTPDANTLNAVYTPSQGEIDAGVLTLTLTSTGNGTCLAVDDDVTYTFGPAPTADAGANQTVCSNNADVSLNGSVTVASGGTWSGGSGTFTPDANTLNATYTPSAADITAGSVTLTLTTTGNGDCLPVTDEMTITFTPSPTASAGSDQTVCGNNPEVNLNGSVTIATGGTWSGGAGSFMPNAGVLNPVYTPSAAEIAAGSVTLTLTTTGNGTCSPVTDNITITITPAPIVDAGVGEELCSNNAAISLNGSVSGATGGTWSGGSGSFVPNANALNAVYSPSQSEIDAGILTLTLTSTGNGNCLSVTDNVTYTFGPSPTADAGADQTVCANNSDVVLNGSVTVATGGTWSGGTGTFSPDANTLNATYTPGPADIAAGNVTLTLTTTGNGDCLPVADSLIISFTPAPTANAGLDATVCANSPEVNLNGSVTVATGGTWSGGGGTFAPDANTLNAVYTPSPAELSSGSVTLTLTTTGNGTCNPETDQMTITITPSPIVDAGVGEELCSNNAAINLNGSVLIATGGTWSGGSGTFTPDASTLNAVYTPSQGEIDSGTLTLTLTSTGNGDCVAVSDNVTYTFGPSPTADAGANVTVCSNNADVTLNGSVTVATGGAWSGGSGTFSPDANTLNATYTPSAADITAGSVTLTLTSTGNGDCLPVSDEMTITFTPGPTANAGSDATVCANNPDVNLNGSISIATGGAWSGGSGTFVPDANSLNAVYTPSAAEIANGSVILTLSTTGNGTCLPATDQIEITITPEPVVDAGADFDVCSNNAEFNLAGSVANAGGGQWSGGLGVFNPDNSTLNATYTPTQPEIQSGSVVFTLTSTGNAGCIAVTDQVTVSFTPSPEINAGVDTSLCAASPDLTLNGSFTIASGVEWSGGTGSFVPNAQDPNAVYTPSPAELSAGSVTLTLTTTGNGNCVPVSDDIEITYDPQPTVSAGADLSSCANDPIVTLNGSFADADGIEWSGGTGFFDPSDEDPNAEYTPSNNEILNGFVTLTITTEGSGSCPDVSDQVNISINPAPVVDAGADFDVCANNSSAELNGSVQFASGGIWSGGAGSFVPSNTALDATYSPTPAEIAAGSVTLTLTSQGNGNCFPETDEVTVTFTPAPQVDAGLDVVICENNADVQLNGSFTVAEGANWSGGAGSYSPDNSTPNAIYTPSQSELDAGSVTLSLTTFGNGDCLPVNDQMTITFTPEPIVDAGEDIFTCVDDLSADLTGSVSGSTTTGIWTTSGSGVFLPDATTLNATYQISAADSLVGEVTLTLTSTNNGTCTPVEDEVTVFILPAGTADAGPDQDICVNNATVFVSGTIGGAATDGSWSTSGTGVFFPDANSPDASYVPGDADLTNGSVTLTFEVNSCNQASDDLVITFTPAPVVDAGEDITVCSSETEVNLAGLISGATTTGTWTTTGSGTFLPDPTALNATYQFSAQDINDQVIELILTSTNFGNCVAVSDTLVLEIFPQGTINLGPDLEACDNDESVALSAMVTGGDQIQWSTSGDGSFSPNNTDSAPDYIPGTLDLLNGTVNISGVLTNSCNLASDAITLNFIPGPIANAGPDQAVCGEVTPFVITGSVLNAGGGQWSTTGSGTFQNPNDLNTFYVASQQDIDNGGVALVLSTTQNGDCLADTDSLFLDISTGIVVEAGPDRQVCEESTGVQLFGEVSEGTTTGIWTTTGTGTFSPSATALNAVYEFSQADIDAGSITLTLTSTNNGICAEQNDSFVLSFGTGAYVFPGDDTEVCQTTTSIPLNGVVNGDANTGIWSTAGTGTFSPSETALNATYQPSQADIDNGSVEITLTSTNNVLCSESSASMTITFQPLPVADAGADAVVCGSIENAQLLGSVSNATGGSWTSSGSGTFVPDNQTLTAQYVPSVADSLVGGVTLTLTTVGNGLCPAESDQMQISFSQAVQADAGGDIEICEDESAIPLSGAVLGSSQFSWSSSGTGSFSPDANTLNAEYLPSADDLSGDSFTLYLTAQGSASCPEDTDSLIVDIDVLPVVSIVASSEFCSGDEAIDLNGNISNADSFVWTSAGTGTFSPDTESEEVTYTPSAAEFNLGEVSITLTATSNGACAPVESEVEIDFVDPPVVNAGIDLILCETDGEIQLQGNSSTGSGIWTTNSFGSFDPASGEELDATYVFGANDILVGFAEVILTSTNNGPCEAMSDTVSFTINPAPTADAGEDLFVCESEGSVAVSGNAENYSSVEWNTEGDGVFLPDGDELAREYIFGNIDALNEEAVLTLRAIGLEGCGNAIDTMVVNISTPLIPDFSSSTPCLGAPVNFTDQTQVLSGEISGYIWDFGDGNIDNRQNPDFIFSEAGPAVVELVVESSLGCSDTTSQVINVVEGPTAAFSVSQTTAPQNLELFFTDESINADAWVWDFGDGLGVSGQTDPRYTYREQGEYVASLVVTGASGCTDSTSTLITITGQIVLPPRVPNSFSPNDDNLNDVYYVRGGPFTQLDFRIYDGWGREIFQTNDQEKGWDGTENGSEVPVGVYVYTIKAINLNGDSFDYSGKINLFR